MRTVLWSSVLSLVSLSAVAAARAESFAVDEPTSDTRVFQVSARQVITGTVETSLANGKAQSLPLAVDAVQKYLERRLPAAGREAEAYRSLRLYQVAESKIDVEKTHSSGQLVAARNLVVSQGRREGVSRYSPNGAMTRADVDLLNVPGDGLALLALLPKSNVESGEKWSPEAWVLQTLAGIDAVTKSELSCEIESATADVAVVKFTGAIEGATVGAATSVNVSGKLRYDRKGRYVRSVEMEQKEKRSVGAVSPGLTVTAKVTLERSPSADQGVLTDAVAEKIPLEPDVSVLMLNYDAPWGIRLVHDRDWHVFHHSGDSAILRLLDKGSLVAQCNLHLMTPAKAGQHTSEEAFQADIQKGLGDQFKSFAGAEEIKTDDGRYLYRVVVDGEGKSKADNAVKPVPTKWVYYLCASPSGQQTSLAFAVQSDLFEKLGNRDLAMVKSLKFLTPMTAKAP
jgi:hypothetical protein